MTTAAQPTTTNTTHPLTVKTQELLEVPVDLAVRMTPGPASALGNPFLRMGIAVLFTIPYAILAMLKMLARPFIKSMSAPGKPSILAFMSDGSFQLLESSPASSKTPIAHVRAFPAGTTFAIDQKRFENSIVAEFTVDDFVGVINGTDLKALMGEVKAGAISNESLSQILPVFEEYQHSVRNREPQEFNR